MAEAFYKFPHALFSDNYAGVSNDGKLLYCLMLDRLGLSQKNGWCDDDGRTFIIFTREEAIRTLGIGKDKVARAFAELEKAELIVQKKRYLGRPTLIYVNELPQDEANVQTAQEQTSEERENGIPKGGDPDFLTAEKRTFKERKNRHSDGAKSAPIKTDNNQTEKNRTDFNQTYPIKTEAACGSGRNDGKDAKNSERLLREQINEAIEADTLKRNYPSSENAIDEIRDIIADVISGRRRVTFEGKTVPEDVAAERFRKLGFENVRLTLEALAESESEIRRIDAYIATTLYSSTFTVFSRCEVGWKRLI